VIRYIINIKVDPVWSSIHKLTVIKTWRWHRHICSCNLKKKERKTTECAHNKARNKEWLLQNNAVDVRTNAFYNCESVKFESTRIRSYDRQRTILQRLSVSGAEYYCWAVNYIAMKWQGLYLHESRVTECFALSLIEGGHSESFLLLFLLFFVCFCFMSSCKTEKVRDVGFSWRLLWCLLRSKITMKMEVVNSSETLENCHAARRQIPENSFRKAGSWGNWLWPYLHECCLLRQWVQNPLFWAFIPKLRM